MIKQLAFALIGILMWTTSALAQAFFPIGAWFPFGDYKYNDLEDTEVNSVLAQVEDCGFNVVNAPLQGFEGQTASKNES